MLGRLNPLSWIGDVVKGAASSVADWFLKDKEIEAAEKAGKLRIQEAKVNAEIAKWEAVAARELMVTKAEIDWDAEALRQMQHSWKDEVLMFAIWVPISLTILGGFLAYFNPDIGFALQSAWEALNNVPGWYQILAIGVVATVFGLRWLVKDIVPSLKGVFGKSSK